MKPAPHLSRIRLLLLLCAGALPLVATACAAPNAGWQRVGGPLYTISGMAYAGADGRRGAQFVVVHDNKKPDEPHVGALILGNGPVEYRRLRWPAGATAPVDLESISAIPDAPDRYLALESSGRVFHLRYDGARLDVLHVSKLPDVPPGANFEGVSVQKLDGQLVVAWGHRGDGKQPGRLFWGTYDLPADAITRQGAADVFVPYPHGHGTRHLADLRVDPGGIVWVSATSDPGDEGPFNSAVYAIGTLNSTGGTIGFRPDPSPTRLWVFRHKVEAIELVPGRHGRIYFGSDDEHLGGWVQAGGEP